MTFDAAEGRRLAFEYEQAMAHYRGTTRVVVRPPTDGELRVWLWEHRAALIKAAGNLEGTLLQLQQRDRVILDLLKTLAETEARLPGITRKPDALP